MADHKKDKWLNTFCPEEACLKEEERVARPVEEKAGTSSKWQETFCPEDSCEISSPSQVP